MKFFLLVTVASNYCYYFHEEEKKIYIFMDFSFVIFQCKRCLLGLTKRRGTLLTNFRPPGYSLDLIAVVFLRAVSSSESLKLSESTQIRCYNQQNVVLKLFQSRKTYFFDRFKKSSPRIDP